MGPHDDDCVACNSVRKRDRWLSFCGIFVVVSYLLPRSSQPAVKRNGKPSTGAAAAPFMVHDGRKWGPVEPLVPANGSEEAFAFLYGGHALAGFRPGRFRRANVTAARAAPGDLARVSRSLAPLGAESGIRLALASMAG